MLSKGSMRCVYHYGAVIGIGDDDAPSRSHHTH